MHPLHFHRRRACSSSRSFFRFNSRLPAFFFLFIFLFPLSPWATAKSRILSTVQEDHGKIFFTPAVSTDPHSSDESCDLLCVDRSTRALLWKKKLPNPIVGLLPLTPSELLVETRIYRPGQLIRSDFSVYSAQNGNLLRQLEDGIFVSSEIFGCRDGLLFLKSEFDTTITCYTPARDKVVWSYDSPRPPAHNPKPVKAFELSNCAMFGRFVLVLLQGVTIQPGGAIDMAATEDGKVVCLRAEDGHPLWEEPIPGSRHQVGHAPIGLQSSKYVAAAVNGTLLIIDRQSAKILKRYQTLYPAEGVAIDDRGRVALMLSDAMNSLHIISLLEGPDLSRRLDLLYEDPRWGDHEITTFKLLGNTLLMDADQATGAIDLKKKTVTKIPRYMLNDRYPNGPFGWIEGSERGAPRSVRLWAYDPQTSRTQVLYSATFPLPTPTPTPAPAHASAASPDASSRLPAWHPRSGICPWGHRNIRDVPVLFGLIIPIPGSELDRAAKDREIILGGCVRILDETTTRTLCATCGARYDSKKQTWSLTSDSPSDFFGLLPPIIATFPLGDHTKFQIDGIYSQDARDRLVRSDKIISSTLFYTTSEPRADLKRRILKYLELHEVKHSGFIPRQDHGIPAMTQSPRISLFTWPYSEELEGDWQGHKIAIRIDLKSQDQWHVNVEVN